MEKQERYDVHQLIPVHRSPLRRRLGMAWYSARRYLLWYSRKYRFAKERLTDAQLPFLTASHATPLLRQLKDVEMPYQYN